MNNAKQLTPEQLKDPAVLEKIRKLTEPIIWHMQTKEAYNLALNLEKSLVATNLRSIDPKLAQEYQDLIIKLQLTALPMLSDDQVVELIGRHFLEALETNIDMENRLTAKLFALPLTPRDDFRQQLQRAIKGNQQKIGSWSIGQWLADYNNFADSGKRTNISPREYLLQSHQASSLFEEEKNKLYRVFHIYDHLLLVTPVVSEEEMNEIVARAGRLPALQKTTPPQPKTAPPATPQQPPQQPSPPLVRPSPPRPVQPIRPMPPRQPRIEGNIVDLKGEK